MSKLKIFWYMRVIYIKRKLRTCTIQIQKEKVWFFPKKKFFLTFSNFFPKGGPFDVKIVKNRFSIFQKFQKQNWKMTFTGPFKHEQKQSHEFWWSLLLPCRNSEAVYGHPGHNGPPLLWIGLIEPVLTVSPFCLHSIMY